MFILKREVEERKIENSGFCREHSGRKRSTARGEYKFIKRSSVCSNYHSLRTVRFGSTAIFFIVGRDVSVEEVLIESTQDFSGGGGLVVRFRLRAEGLQVRNPIPLKICRVWGLLHAKSYVVDKRSPSGVVHNTHSAPGHRRCGAYTTHPDSTYPTGLKAKRDRGK
ncbi:hypothetical protein AVEN_113224-1 [Araneus ventricosus]|uniref:Uncharacterized protein n=1 Tax=Araneus ventricosus TaxID=182803 RepID=A0A4Y2UX12_ARAVE|nr:hypothetical protein AVEN_113224-1 [Araneus ventricosus]